MTMVSVPFPTPQSVTNAMMVLSPADRAACVAHPQPDGTYLVEAPDSIEAALRDSHPEAPLPVPVEISRAQAKIQLSRAGLLDGVREAVSAAGGEVEIWFSEASTWRRDSPYVAEIGAVLTPPLDAAAIDTLFRDAAQIAA